MTSSWAPLAMLFLSPALIGATRSRSNGSLLRLLVADLIAIAVVISIHATRPDDNPCLIVAFYMTALVALLLTGTLLGATVRFTIEHLYTRTVARRASP
jgi:hypothetical protein